jgi:methyltransferase
VSPVAFVCLLALIAAQRLRELAVSRRNLAAVRARHGATLPPAAGGSAAWIALVALHAALIVAPAIEAFVRRPRVPVAVVVVAASALLAGQLLRAWAVRSLGPAWNARAVVDPALPIVARGPYRFVRHPNYLAIVLEFLSIPLLGGAWISWVALNVANAFVLAARIRGEERLLARIPAWNERIAAKGALLPRFSDLRAQVPPPAGAGG